MSIRESIASNIVTTLENASSPVSVSYVTREPFNFNELSNAQFPAILVQTASESREDITIGDDQITRQATIIYDLIGYVKSTTIDTARNNLVETIEEALDADRTRGGNAIDTQVISIETDEGAISPVGGVIVTVEVMYNFTRGNT
jgi:hypothetical protein